MKTKDVLIKARALIVKGWCQGISAANKDGDEVWPKEHEACYFCATGAIIAVTDRVAIKDKAVSRLAKQTRCNVPVWNDAKGRTKRQVLALYTRAIKAL